MNVSRTRLLSVSLAVALVVSGIGAYIWSQTVADSGSSDDVAVMENSQDREFPDDPFAIETSPELDGVTLPEATVSDRDGNAITTASLTGGQPMVINFWFSTCPPCAAELPEFADAHAEYADEVRFIGINTIDPIPTMERFAGERGVTYELFRDDLAEFTDGIGAVNFPITIFVTSDGTIVEQTGVIDLEGLREKITNLQEQEELV